MVKFDFYKIQSSKGDFPVGPSVRIVLLGSTSRNERGDLFVSSELATEEEVDVYFDKLESNLQSIRKKAKRSLNG
jgi:hypothetical protein